ncbi:TPA: hypothetical protein HA278_03405 [Candidatus Woesearchaeota archaeon]|nr:hypothetical protein [Candidatus Woesearchaeota archaeon]
MNIVESFIPDRKWVRSLLSDIGAIGGIAFIFITLGVIIQTKLDTVLQGTPVQDVMALLESGQPQVVQALAENLQSYIIFIIVAISLTCLLTLAIYGMSRQYLWGYLTRTPFKAKQSWKWMILSIVLVALFFFYAIPAFLTRTILTFLTSTFQNESLVAGVSATLGSWFVFIYLLFIFVVFHEFAKKQRIFATLMNVYKTFSQRKREFGKLIFVLLGAIVAVGFISFVVTKFIFHPTYLMIYHTAIFLLFLSWLRLYTVKVLE